MGSSNRLGTGIIALWAATTTTLSLTTPNTRYGMVASLQSSRSSGYLDHRPSSELLATDDANPCEREKESESIPDIQELRDEIRKWSRTRTLDAPSKATSALKAMFRYHGSTEKKRSQNAPSCVDVIDCTQVINAWSKSRRRDSPQQALTILKLMIAIHKKNGNDRIRPNTITYSSVINAYARRGDFYGALDVFAMQVNDFKRRGNEEAKPNAYAFNSLINACAKSKSEDMSKTAEKLLATMNDWYLRGDLEDGPDAYTYSSIINCFSKSNEKNAPSKARKILETMVSEYGYGNKDSRRNTVTYAAVMNAYARQGDAMGATEVFKMMEKDYQFGNKEAKLDVQIYNILVDAWSKSSQKDAPSRSRDILKIMLAQYEAGNKNIRPDTVTYATVMNTYAKQGDIIGATETFEMMTGDYQSGNANAEPNVNAYSILIDAWSKSSEKDAPRRARDILDTVIAESITKKSLRPDAIVYNSVLNAYATRGYVNGATEVFEMMKKDHRTGNKNAEPNIRTYNILMDAWSKSTQKDAPIKSRNILNTVVNESKTKKNMSPDTITYNSALNAHANHGDFEGAAKIFEMMKKDYNSGNENAKPNAITYNILTDILPQFNNGKIQKQAPDGVSTPVANAKVKKRKV
ncbi:unnamed protein product [Pseudo-nitzschia multistriata]|uniref:Pentacotripeptide-repeat region of PRORP domain-containing protein n=1 Tax=Pseudo-nitzschia multistriata TaxID=183589 RepID=A0A448Z7K3_9STRA|nr:unnamed protein product [Pseudo-nitzschia multistriata]